MSCCPNAKTYSSLSLVAISNVHIFHLPKTWCCQNILLLRCWHCWKNIFSLICEHISISIAAILFVLVSNLRWLIYRKNVIKHCATLAQVMTCCLTATSHYLDQCWLIISEVLWNSSENNFTSSAQDVYNWYRFEHYFNYNCISHAPVGLYFMCKYTIVLNLVIAMPADDMAHSRVWALYGILLITLLKQNELSMIVCSHFTLLTSLTEGSASSYKTTAWLSVGMVTGIITLMSIKFSGTTFLQYLWYFFLFW